MCGDLNASSVPLRPRAGFTPGRRSVPEARHIAAMNVLDHIPLDNSNVSPDVLGDAHEYLIKRFADANKGGTTAGQFYTPPEVREIIIRTIQPQPG